MDKSFDNNTHNTQSSTKKGADSIGETVVCAHFSLFPSAPCPHFQFYSGVANVVHGKFSSMLFQVLVSLV